MCFTPDPCWLSKSACTCLRPCWTSNGNESHESLGDKVGESLGGSQGPPSFWKVPGLPQKFHKLSRKFFGHFPGSSLTVELDSNPGVPWNFPRVPGKFPGLPQKFPGVRTRSAPFPGKPDSLSWLAKLFSESQPPPPPFQQRAANSPTERLWKFPWTFYFAQYDSAYCPSSFLITKSVALRSHIQCDNKNQWMPVWLADCVKDELQWGMHRETVSVTYLCSWPCKTTSKESMYGGETSCRDCRAS